MKLHLRLIAHVCVLSLGIACSEKQSLNPVKAGVVDLSALQFAERAPLPLNGEWEYFPNQLLLPEEIPAHAHEARLAHVPANMHGYSDTGLRTARPGVATYRVQILLPPKLTMYSLRLPELPSALRCYVNGLLQTEIGKPSSDPTKAVAATRVQYLQLPLAGKTEIVLQIVNADYPTGGITQPVLFSSSRLMESYRLRRLSEEIIVIVALVILGIYHFVFTLLRHPERASGFFGLFCVLTGIGRMFNGETLINVLIPQMPWELKIRSKLAIDCIYAFFLMQYVRYFFSELVRCPALRYITWIPVIFAGASLALPLTLAVESRFVFHLVILLMLPIVFYKLVQLAWQNVFGARIVLIGGVILVIAFVHDALLHRGIIFGNFWFAKASLIFTLVQAFVISAKSLQLFHQNRELSERLLRSDKLRDEFLEQVSHELRTPVQAMVQTIENVRQGLSGAVSEPVQRTLAVVEESGLRLMYLIDDLQDFIRLKHGDLRLNLQTVSLRKVIEPVLKLGLGLTENKQFAIIDEIPDALEDVKVDPVRLQQILLNLLNIAIRYSHSNTIRVKSGKIDGQLAISVVYNGTAPDARYTATLVTENEEIPALMTQKLAELMGGKYLYHKFSESQHALIMTVPYEHIETLERIIESSQSRREHRTTSEIKISMQPQGTVTPVPGAAKVLVIGDHAGQNRLLQEQLASLGKTVAIAKNGAEGILYLQNNSDVCLVICDVLLSDISGIELTMNIRTQFDIGLLPVILIIDSNQAGMAASAFSAGVNDLIRRPFEKAEVVARVRNLLLQREASLARENYRALNRELEIARSIQESILPTLEPRSSYYQIETVCMPARSIGGDFYDFIETEDLLGVLIADVAGHGIPAALYAAMLKIAFHNLRDKARFPEELLKELNNTMIDKGERTFISCAYTLLDFKNKRLLHANAGHLPLLIQAPGQRTVKRIQPPGGVLGVRKAAAITVEMHHLQPKTRLTLFTDGVVEITNKQGRFFDEERLVRVLEDTRYAPLTDAKEALLSAMREFAEGESFLDDVTFVLIDLE